MVELEDFKYGGTNITALRLVDPTDEKVCPDLSELRVYLFEKSYFKSIVCFNRNLMTNMNKKLFAIIRIRL